MLFFTKNLQFAYPGQTRYYFPDISLDSGDSLLVLGKSGSGKTTLLNLLSGLLVPDSGEVVLNGVIVNSLKGVNADRFRGENIGIVFQKPHLLAPLTVKENLQMARHFSKSEGLDLDNLLSELNLSHKSNSSIAKLSEGEAQRVSIARALVNKPRLILADEPTSSLDDENAHKVISLLQNQASKIEAALIIVTHDQRVKDQISNFIQVQAP
ncbi:ATP-binding cassette domain-containing protein [Algoriphagus kandeliae]|uniref:ATP-binding cassette domain-containing protein n=1 Tax=Algoriphagus kandeliae TaxID=2562278 RepID=A0A4Y9QK37_9BACT|nr:ATP-binding cassette domain-containing protein [Algoriphagus kandeliae]TFV93074.1 ATP-binding cassette domain-containing protein [Algoriphagus kandeliae]